jgi:hypothetical protein
MESELPHDHHPTSEFFFLNSYARRPNFSSDPQAEALLLVSEKLEVVLRQRLAEVVNSALNALLRMSGGIRLSTLSKLLIAQKLGIHLRAR